MSRPTINQQGAYELEDGLSMSSMLLAPLNELQSLAHVLFQSLSPPQSRPPLAPSATSFITCDKNLAHSVNLAHKHQIKQRKIDSLEADILELEAQWRQICTELAEGKSELEAIIEEGGERIKAIEEAKEGTVIFGLLTER